MSFGHLLATNPSRLVVSRRSAGGFAHLRRMKDDGKSPDGFERAITLSELAERLGVSTQAIYDLRSQGRGPKGFRIGRHLRFRMSEVDAWLQRLEDADGHRSERGER